MAQAADARAIPWERDGSDVRSEKRIEITGNFSAKQGCLPTATDLDPKALPPGLTKLELFEKLAGHVKGSTGIIGLFKNPL